MSLCSVPSRADEWGSTGVRSGSETVGIYYTDGTQVVLNNTYYTNYSTTLSPTSSGGTTYNTFCVDLLHEATTTYTQLATPPALTSSYSGGSATNPGTVSNNAFGYAAWLANNYSSTATTADQQAGLQIAIWKVLYETDRSKGLESLGTGAIRFSGNAAAISDATTYVTDWVQHREQSASALLVNYATTDGDHAQYQMIAVSTPEPSTLAIACLGVLGFVGYGLKHRRRRA